jgi:hypothetical protein
MRGQHREGGDGHVVVVTSNLGTALVLCGSHDLGSGLAILVRNRTIRVPVIRLVLGESPVLDVMAVALLTLHDAMDGARRSVLAVVVQMTLELPLFALAMALIDVAVSVATTPVLVEVGV